MLYSACSSIPESTCSPASVLVTFFTCNTGVSGWVTTGPNDTFFMCPSLSAWRVEFPSPLFFQSWMFLSHLTLTVWMCKELNIYSNYPSWSTHNHATMQISDYILLLCYIRSQHNKTTKSTLLLFTVMYFNHSQLLFKWQMISDYIWLQINKQFLCVEASSSASHCLYWPSSWVWSSRTKIL